MLALRYAASVAIALWIGGLLALGAVAAPAIFDVMAARNVPDGRVLAGAVFGEALGRFQPYAYGAATVIGASFVARAALGPRPSRFGIRFGILGAMLVATLYFGFVLTPQIEQARIAAGGAPSTLPEGDPLRVRFGRLHGFSAVLQLVPILGGLALLFWELRD
ncbi:MAG: DUF4149 domain-containing protein [Vicinamibacterales bacterium]